MTFTAPVVPAMRNLREVIHSQAIQPTFQPVVRLEDGVVKAYEALARFDKAHFPSPADAFAAAMEAGVGVDLELLALERAFTYLDEMPAGAWLSANLSVEALLDPRVSETLMAHAARGIAVELTEHTQVHDYPALVKVTERLRSAGILLAVDDAGAGFASLSHILQLRPDIIKLDITLTRGIDTDPVRMALARSLVGFAEDIGAMLIAEGIETVAEHEKLRALGVKLGQGYFMARPGPLPARAEITADGILIGGA
ncbi:EAL domain-containing protein [Couchioplanes caeruleus]|uniref:Signaling protein n=3 Tax=Couchioplanes caeruleus TaxID=56438 RepID=A0A1K0G2A3_9ACTN|nr:EAL domain-containing protein [Couchioplanes caeruleus]OJF11434.1 signaling protein [Couchioplanes caeruleus subsp. caeruleus]